MYRTPVATSHVCKMFYLLALVGLVNVWKVLVGNGVTGHYEAWVVLERFWINKKLEHILHSAHARHMQCNMCSRLDYLVLSIENETDSPFLNVKK